MKNGHTLMLFRDIFDMYQNISNKVVGILARARKNKLVHFEGETLFQGQSDLINVTLLRSIADIEGHYKETKELLYNDEAKNLYVIRYQKMYFDVPFLYKHLSLQAKRCIVQHILCDSTIWRRHTLSGA